MRRTPVRIATTIVALTLMLAACGSSGGGSDSSSKGSDTSSDSSGGGTAASSVSIKGFKFNPADITAKVGDTITFTNDDSSTHTATSDDGPASFDTGDLAKGKSGKVKLSKAGTYKYQCSIHSSMTGTIEVK